MERAFITAWEQCRSQAAAAGIRMRPVAPEEAMKTAHRILTGSRLSDGFSQLAARHHLEWSLEALSIDKRFTSLFTDAEANEALNRLMEAGYFSIQP